MLDQKGSSDPDFPRERQFHEAVVAHLRDRLDRRTHDGVRYIVLSKTSLDTCVLIDGERVVTRFIELKAYWGQRPNGRIGFGNGNGQGPQVELM
jgi:hypothetical protein